MTKNNKSERWKVVLPWVLVALWAVFIFYMSAHTGQSLDSGDDLIGRIKQWLKSIQDNIAPGYDLISPTAHFIEYTVFGVLLNIALSGHMRPKAAFIVAICIGSAYGITDEIHQIFVQDRTCDVLDWLVDTAGTSLGAACCYIALKHSKRTEHAN